MPAASFRPATASRAVPSPGPVARHEHVAAQGSRAGAHLLQRLHEAAALFALREQNAVLAPHRRDLEAAPAHEIEHLRVAHAGVVAALEIRVAQLDAVPSRVLDGRAAARRAAWCRASRCAAARPVSSNLQPRQRTRKSCTQHETCEDADSPKVSRTRRARAGIARALRTYQFCSVLGVLCAEAVRSSAGLCGEAV